jgi:ADP-ribose pyrophosphatase
MADTPAAPVLGTGAIVRRDDAVLLVRRANPPYAGEWAIPGGRVQLGETLKAAAEREILEETGVRIRAGDPAYTFEYIERDTERVLYHYVVVDLFGTFVEGEPKAGDDAAEAAWVALNEMDALPVNAETRRALATVFPDLAGGKQ